MSSPLVLSANTSTSSLTLLVDPPRSPKAVLRLSLAPPILPPKGPLQPQRNNIPRRKKRTIPAVSPSPSPLAAPQSPSPSPSPLPALPDQDATPRPTALPRFTASPPPVRAPLTNIPRRTPRRTPSPAQLARRAALQHLLHGIWVALPSPSLPTAPYACIFHISSASPPSSSATPALTLSVPTAVSDAGVPHLTPAQLRAARAFSHAHPGPVLITAPADRAVDAMSLAACLLAAPSPSAPAPSMPGTPCVSRAPSVSSVPFPRTSTPRTVHALLMALNALPEHDDDEGAPVGPTMGLRATWRGAVSRAGMDYVQDVVDEAAGEGGGEWVSG